MTPSGATLLLAVAQLGTPTIVGMESSVREGEQIVTIDVEPELSGVSVLQEEAEIRITLDGIAPLSFEPPVASGALEGVTLVRGEGTVTLRLRVPAGTVYRMERTRTRLSLRLEPPPPAPETADLEPPSVEELFPLLFPAGVPGEEEKNQGVDNDEEAEPGLRVGFLSLQPGLLATYTDANSTYQATPRPARTRFYQIEPRLEATASLRLGNGRLMARYQPSFRRGSDFQLVNETSHAVDATLEMPLTPVTTFNAAYRFLRGTLEAREVDPGGEFFYGLGRFTHHGLGADLAVETGARTAVGVRGYYDSVHIDDPIVESEDGGVTGRTAFFSYERLGFDAGLRYELGPGLDARFGYAYDEVPEPETRAVARSRAHLAFAEVEGEIAFLTTGQVRLGYRHQQNENVVGRGRSFDGLDARASIRREFSRAASIQLLAGRTTYPSGFENDGFYVGNRAELRLLLPLPKAFSFQAGAAQQLNTYEQVRPPRLEPRRDHLSGWTLGLARPLSERAFLRLDYRQDKRRSNIHAFDIDTDALTVQLGVGLFAPPSR